MDQAFTRLFRVVCISAVLLFAAGASFAQKRDSLYQLNKDKMVVLRNNKFKVYNNWITAGAGIANNFTQYGPQFTLGADFQFHIKADYYQLGFYFVGDRFGNYNDYNYHFGYGRRFENEKINFSGFAGLAYSTGYQPVNDNFSPDKVYDRLGAYACVQFVKKITYDTGIGTSLFVNYNTYQFISGLRLDIYFSGAYKGKAKKTSLD